MKSLRSQLNEIQSGYYHTEARPYNFKEACLIVSGVAVLMAGLFVGLVWVMN